MKNLKVIYYEGQYRSIKRNQFRAIHRLCNKMYKKKILMVGPFQPTVGGITTFMLNLLTSKLTKKFEFIPFTTTRPTIGVTKNVFDYTLFFNIGFKNLIKSALIILYHLIQFPIILITSKSEIIHINTSDYWSFWENSIYVLISRLLLRKIIIHIHATTFHNFYYNGNIIEKTLIKKTLLMADKIIILSSGQKKVFINLISENKLSIIHNVTNFKMFQSQSKIRINENSIIKVLFIGGEEAKRKGIYDIIEAIPIIINKYRKNITFIFLGRCDIKNLKNICIKKGIENYVKFKGYLKEKEKIKIMNSSDIFLLPSYAEGMPIAMLEAMAAGLPVISTLVGSIPEVIKEKINGYLIEPGDYKALANRIILLAKNKSLRKKIGNNNRTIILKKYDLNILENKMESLYNELLT